MKSVFNLLNRTKELKGKIVRCPYCKNNSFRQIVINPVLKQGRISGGTKQLICDRCNKPISGG